MKKADLVENVSSRLGMNKKDVEPILEALIDELKTSVNKGETVYMRGFGTLGPKVRKAKTARNISTGGTLLLPNTVIPFFKPAKEFKESVKQLGIHDSK